MKKHIPKIILSCLCIVLSLVICLTLYNSFNPLPEQTHKFSMVLYGNNESRWLILEQGIKQACDEYPLISSGILLSGESTEEQIKTINREIENNTQGLIISANNSKELHEYLTTISSTIPIIMVENGAGKQFEAICASSIEMGNTLAEEVFASGSKNIVLLDSFTERESSNAKKEAFLNRLAELGIQCDIWSPKKGSRSLSSYISAKFTHNTPEILVTLDNESLEQAIQAVQLSSANVGLYGIGCSETIARALDNGIVKAVCFQNEFNIGYIASLNLAKELGLGTIIPDTTIPHIIVRKDNMYDPEIARLLFPIIQ